MKSKQMKRLGTALIVAGVLMITAALGLVIYNKVQSDMAGDASEDALGQLEMIMFNNQINGTTGAPDAEADGAGMQ